LAIQAVNAQKGSPVERAARTPQDVIRLLLGQTQNTERHAFSGERDDSAHESEEIILDVDLDGARYLVLRLPLANRRRPVLSPREQEIVRMVSQGHPNKVIAEVLNISSWTVCTHMRRIFAKVGVTSRAAMVARLLETAEVAEHAIPSSLR
jgi:two-component system, NarL family, nitrate/nitrite response regulator NarL